ncbi:MAG: class I adenylate-forming enzyme family protein [Chthoniobacterales bacterium]
MSQVRNHEDPLLSAWAETRRRRPDAPAILDAQGRVICRFAELESESLGYEIAVRKTLRAGEIVAVQIGNHPHWPALFLACLRSQVVVLPLERTMSEQERASALATCRASALITAVENGIERLDNSETPDWGERRPNLLKLTSGTTAAPRAIRFRSAQLLADAEQICDTMGITEADLNFAVIPLSHSYGFSNLITPLLVRGVPMAISNDRIPRAVLDDLERTKATVFAGMPLFYQAFNEMNEVPSLPNLRLCISAGAPLGQRVAEKFLVKFGQPIHSFYGASECGGICFDRDTSAVGEGFVGPALDGVELEALVPGGTSQMRVRSAAVGDDYFPETDRTKLGQGTFRPDDLVTITDGDVRIVGRLSDVINVAGKKVNPAEVEAHLLSHPDVRQAVVFGRASSLRNQEVAACVVAAEPGDEVALLEYCRARLSGWQVPKRIFFVDVLPANERGKISRRELAGYFSI